MLLTFIIPTYKSYICNESSDFKPVTEKKRTKNQEILYWNLPLKVKVLVVGLLFMLV